MLRTCMKSTIAGVFLLGLATAAFAVNGEFGNMCAASLAAGKDTPTDCSINGQYVSRQDLLLAVRRPWLGSCRTLRTIWPRRRPTTQRSIPGKLGASLR